MHRRSAPPRAVLAVRAGWPAPASRPLRLSAIAVSKCAGEAARACAGEGDRAPLNRRVRGGDGLVQQLEGVRVQERGEQERELQLHGVPPRQPWLVVRRARAANTSPPVCGAPRAAARLAASRSVATVGRLARRFGAEQVQGDSLRLGTLAHEQRRSLGMLSRPRTCRHAGVRGFPRSTDARAPARALSSSTPAARSASAARAAWESSSPASAAA